MAMAMVGALLSFVVTITFMFCLRPLAVSVGLVDVPGGHKRHDALVPITGGVAMGIGFGFASAIVDHPSSWGIVLMAIYMLVVIGTIDDRLGLPVNARLVAQICAALLVTLGAGIAVTDLGTPLFFHLPLGSASTLFTLLFIVTVINGYNVIDGLDGLAGSLALIAVSALSIVGYGTPIFPIAVSFATVVAAFLVFNVPLPFNRSHRAFMGDAGSTALGLGIACIGITLSQGADAVVSPVVGLWFVAVPVFDIFSAMIRRSVDGKSPLTPDHLHLHQTLVLHGLSRLVALAVILAFALACAAVGIGAHVLALPDGVHTLLWFGAGWLYYTATRNPSMAASVARRVLERSTSPSIRES